jgi:RluA family pseudouridine synthase
MILTARVSDEQNSLRLDDGAKDLFPQLSKGEIRRIIDLGGCAVNQVMVRVASRQLRTGDEIALGVMEEERFVDVRYRTDDLLYEDRSYLAVNKASGINSQRTPYQFKGTVEYAVGQYLKELGSLEPARVVHRLDRGTSGVMFFPKTKAAATWVSDRLKAGEVEKVYWAIVTDLPEEEAWTVDAPIGKLNKFRYGVTVPGRPSLTDFRVIASAGNAALIEAQPKTGRTHQIRVHLTHTGLPILGDQPYGGAPAPRMMLHCRMMRFVDQGNRIVSACAPPDDLFTVACAERGLALPPEEPSASP